MSADQSRLAAGESASASDVYLGIEIGGSKLQVIAGSAAGSIFQRWRGVVPPGSTGRQIQQILSEGIDAVRDQINPVAAGAGFGGPVDRLTGRIQCSHQVPGWEDFDLADWLSHATGLAVAVENDANVAAFGEALLGAGAGADPVFYCNFGSGVGGGLVRNGEIYHGLPPGECEFGHLLLDRSGATVESRCCGWAVDAKIRELKGQSGRGILSDLAMTAPGAEARHLPTALKANDPDARRIIEETAGDIAFALSHVVHLFHPERIVIGGGLSLVGEPLRREIERALAPLVMTAFQPPPAVHLAALGEDAVPIGAMVLASRLRTPA